VCLRRPWPLQCGELRWGWDDCGPHWLRWTSPGPERRATIWLFNVDELNNQMGHYNWRFYWETIWLFNIANWKIHYKWRFLARKIICFYGPFSTAMLNNQMVKWRVERPTKKWEHGWIITVYNLETSMGDLNVYFFDGCLGVSILLCPQTWLTVLTGVHIATPNTRDSEDREKASSWRSLCWFGGIVLVPYDVWLYHVISCYISYYLMVSGILMYFALCTFQVSSFYVWW